MHRRDLLSLAAATSVPIAGCTGERDPGGTGGAPTTTPAGADGGPTTTETPTDRDEPALPEDCPTTQGLDVEWPEDLDAETVESFVEAYEHVYHRDVVVGYEPRSRLDSYELSGGVRGPPRETGDGRVLAYDGSGGIFRPTLALGATRTDPPEGADVVPRDDVEDEFEDGPVVRTLEEAAAEGESDHHVDPPGERVDRHVDAFAALSDEFEGLSSRGTSDTLYVDVDGTPVELTVAATDFHGDYWWEAWYYVDERVVRRTTEEDADPRDGELLECRAPG